MNTPDEGSYASIRDILGRFIGQTLVDITQHDREEFESGKESYVCLMFSEGETITFPVGDGGFSYSDNEPDDDTA